MKKEGEGGREREKERERRCETAARHKFFSWLQGRQDSSSTGSHCHTRAGKKRRHGGFGSTSPGARTEQENVLPGGSTGEIASAPLLPSSVVRADSKWHVRGPAFPC